jgi:oligoendopeptidase F
VYSILANADMPWPTVTLSDGTEARLDQSGYTRWRSAPNRADRELVFDAFWATWKEWERTCGVSLYSQVKRDLFYARARRYPSTLAAALDRTNVPEAVYHTLIEATNANLDTLHRYFRLRGRMLGVDRMRYVDIYPPLVTTDLEFPIEVGRELVLDALEPLGPSYVATVRTGFTERWMDTYPRPGKRAGAYSNGSVYDVHPYVLMNYNDDYESVSTLAHEWGHAMHSALANAAQPYPTAEYSIFIAEVASTFNEALLLDHVLETAKDDTERLYYLGSALEGLRGTFFRQAMFAEFELLIHRAVEGGEALSGERLTREYGELLKRFHGHDQGVVAIDDAYAVEWAYIPHFYYNYYVYQYATALAAASLFADDVLAGKPGAAERYLGALAAGGSEHPYELLREAGVDLASPAPYQALIARMNRIMDEIETILDRRQGAVTE